MTEPPPVERERPTPADRRRERVEAFAHELVVAMWNGAMYGPTTDEAQSGLRSAVATLGSVFAAGEPPPFRLEAAQTCLRWAGRDLIGPSLQARRLVRRLRERRVTALCFDATLDAGALGRFVDLLTDDAQIAVFRAGVIEHVLADRGMQGIGVELAQAGDDGEPAAAGAERSAIESYQQLADVLQESHVSARRGRELSIDAARGIVERAVARMGTAPSDLLALAVYDDIDRFTVGHSVRVALLALEVARAAGATDDELLLVGTAGLLHDIGKSQIPQDLLFKQAALEPEEWAVMAEHPRLGAEILVEQHDVHPSAIGAAFCHHMAPDGDGYPTPVATFTPSGISRLIRVCDVFEALTAVRPYKRDLTPLEAMAIMHRERAGFDPDWLRFFFRTLGIYPIGTRLRLDSGEKALVVAKGPSCDRPIVRLLEDEGGAPLAAPRELTIGVAEDGVVRSIAAIVRRHASEDHDDRSPLAIAAPATACLPAAGADGGGPCHGAPDSAAHR